MKGTVHYETRGNIALMSVDNPPVNPLSSGVRQGLYDGVAKALEDDAIIKFRRGFTHLFIEELVQILHIADRPSLDQLGQHFRVFDHVGHTQQEGEAEQP